MQESWDLSSLCKKVTYATRILLDKSWNQLSFSKISRDIKLIKTRNHTKPLKSYIPHTFGQTAKAPNQQWRIPVSNYWLLLEGNNTVSQNTASCILWPKIKEASSDVFNVRSKLEERVYVYHNSSFFHNSAPYHRSSSKYDCPSEYWKYEMSCRDSLTSRPKYTPALQHWIEVII